MAFAQRFPRGTISADRSDLESRIRTALTGEPCRIEPLSDDGVRIDVVVDKPSAWTDAQITAVQGAVTAAVAASAALSRQAEVDKMSVLLKATILTLVDQINVVRAASPTSLPPITPAQVMAAIRTKAGQ